MSAFKLTGASLVFALAMTTGCGDDTSSPTDSGMTEDSGMSGDSSMPDDTGTTADSSVDPDAGVVPPNPEAEWLTPDMMTFDDAIPGVVGMATVWGDRASGEHETIVKVTATMGIPSHTHTMGIHSLVLGGPMMIPVPSNETTPSEMMNGGYGFVPAAAEHRMGCPASEDCLFLIHQAGAFDLILEDTPPTGDAERNPAAPQMAIGDLTFIDIIAGVQFAPVVGDFSMEAHGTMVKVTMGMGIPAHWHTMAVRGYVVQGDVEVPVPFDQTNPLTMNAGSYYFVPATAPHAMNCVSADMDCYFYMRQSGAFDFNPITPEE